MSYFSSDKFNRIKEWDLAFTTVENQGGVRTWQKFLVKCLTTIMIDEKESAIILLTQDYHLEKSQHLNIEPFTRSQNTHTVTKLEEEDKDSTLGFGFGNTPQKPSKELATASSSSTAPSAPAMSRADQHEADNALRMLMLECQHQGGIWTNTKTGKQDTEKLRATRLRVFDAAQKAIATAMPDVKFIDRGDIRMLWQKSTHLGIGIETQLETRVKATIQTLIPKKEGMSFSHWFDQIRGCYQELESIGREPDARAKITDLISALQPETDLGQKDVTAS